MAGTATIAWINNSGNGILTGLVSYYKMDESSGTIIDSQSANNSTLVVNATYSVAGIINTCVSLGDGGIEISDPANLRLTNTGSINLWMYMPVLQNATMVGKLNLSGPINGYSFTTSGGFLHAVIADGSGADDIASPSAVFVIDTWYMSTMTWDGGTISIYVNGALVNSGSQTRNASSTGINLTFARCYNGTDYDHSNYKDSSRLEEIGIWNTPLNATQITALYNGGSGLPYSSFS